LYLRHAVLVLGEFEFGAYHVDELLVVTNGCTVAWECAQAVVHEHGDVERSADVQAGVAVGLVEVNAHEPVV
jgi:hypothetical protein